MKKTERKIRFFHQHSVETCGISCILMLLDHYRKIQYPTAGQEMKLYRMYRCRAFKGTLASAIADCLSKYGLHVELYHSFSDYMGNEDGYFPEDLYQAMLKEYKGTIQAISDRVFIETGCVFSPDWYRGKLDEGKQLIVHCIVPGNADGMHDRTLHWIVLYGYEGNMFLSCDPLSSKIRLSEEELEGYTKTPVGSICIAADQNDCADKEEQADQKDE